MAGRRTTRKRTHLDAPGYPSFLGHRTDRRQFLRLGLAGLGAAALAACEGSEDPDITNTAGVNGNNGYWPPVNNNNATAPYESVHFPSVGDHTTTLADGGTLRWSATATTHTVGAAEYGESYNESLTTKLSSALAGYTSDALATPSGVSEAADTLRDLLNTTYADDFGQAGAVPFESLDLYVIDLLSP